MNHDKKNFLLMSLGALGVVFGDIGTSPLYAVSQIFFANEGQVLIQKDNVLGIISLIIWALVLVVSVKYLQFVMRASNDGEGGVFSLYGLLYQHRKNKKLVSGILTLLILSAGFLFGDGMITPAISVLSAVEGLKFSFPSLESAVVPISMLILAGLFFIQKKGTSRVGIIFGPILLIWFFALAYLGLLNILTQPEILQAVNPLYAIDFLKNTSLKSLVFIFGGIILVITGGEALYADMGHFDVKSIRSSWFIIVFPSLILNYLGQGAYLLSGKSIQFSNIFYSSIPESLKFPMLILATAATVIASQALISGVFSLASQAVALGLLPRIKIHYTHQAHSGQVYVPLVNWVLLFGCLFLVFTFKESQNLASAYGLAVAVDMFITSVSMLVLSFVSWRWRPAYSFLLFGFFAAIDFFFVGANSLKIPEGGYIPLSVGLALFFIMTTWRWGRKMTYAAYSSVQTMQIQELVEEHRRQNKFVQKNILLLIPKPVQSLNQNAPALMQMIHDRFGMLANNIFFVEIIHKKVPFLHNNRYDVQVFEKNDHGMIASVAVKFGFMEEPNVEKVLEGLASHNEIMLDPKPEHWVFHVSQENFHASRPNSFWHQIRLSVFSLFRQISRPAYVYYGLGDQVQLSVQIIPVKI